MRETSEQEARPCRVCGLIYKHSMTCALGDGKYNSAPVLDSEREQQARTWRLGHIRPLRPKAANIQSDEAREEEKRYMAMFTDINVGDV